MLYGLIFVVTLFRMGLVSAVEIGGGSSDNQPLSYNIVVDDFEGPSSQNTEAGGLVSVLNSDWEVLSDAVTTKKDSLKFGYFEEVPRHLNYPGGSKKSFGFKIGFILRTYNWIDISPKERKPVYQDYVSRVSTWVWGSKMRYDMEVHLRDQRNRYYPFSMGRINHVGWKSMVAMIPHVYSSRAHDDIASKERGLSFVKFRFYADPKENADRLYVFLDRMEVVTTAYVSSSEGRLIMEAIEKLENTKSTGGR